MSLYDCIERAIEGGMLPRGRARAAQELLQERLAAHAHLGPGAEAAAAQDVWLHLRRSAQERKRTNLLQIDANLKILDAVTNHVETDGTANASHAPRQLIEWGQTAKFQNVQARGDALEAQYMRMISQLIQKHKRDIFGGVRSKALLGDVVRELHGEASGSAAAKQTSDAVREALEIARTDFNAAGGSIGKLGDYGLPHAWDDALIRKTDFDSWAREIGDRLDWDRIVDRNTSKPFRSSDGASRQRFLREVYDNITSNGWASREPAGVQLGRATANSRSDHRVLHFKSADDWMAVNEKFGRNDPFSAIVSHLKSMARDTASMQVLGPNPRAGLELAIQTSEKLARERPWKQSVIARNLYTSPASEARGRGRHARRMFDLYTGAANKVESDVVAGGFSGLRHFLVASQLGGAMLSAVSDVGFQAMAARHVGIDWNKVIGRQLRAVASSKDRALMARMGIIADSAANTGVAQARLMGDDNVGPMMERLSEFTMRASGLTAWTDIGRGAFRLEFYGFLADNAARSFDDLDAPLRTVMAERGFTPDDWNVIRATELARDPSEPAAAFLVPGDIRYRTDIDTDLALDLSLRLEGVVREQMEFAVPSASLRGRAAFDFGAPGTLAGELLKSGLMYKSFGMSMIFNQLGRVLFHRVNGSRIANIAMFATITTAAGALSIQLKEMAKGRDPRPMLDDGQVLGVNWEFLGAAKLQGGGFGIYGDFISSTQNRFGGGLASTLGGPAVGFVNDTLGLARPGVAAITGGQKEQDQFGRAATKYLNRYSGPTNLWYINQVLDRALWDNLQELVDHDAQKAFRREERRRVKDFHNPSYWPRGAPVPQRLPDILNALESD
ncbi:hypothetical protein [Roseobacter sp.]|uniref:hypothetical protein n=1 Tax=Roseobacter sp. TaxID=1907202 RepID=UPI002966D924|nr:hypothetical protein [Roseobacter sp.]MDW3181779.1 hypothetical protein [Roseobacter sp.]